MLYGIIPPRSERIRVLTNKWFLGQDRDIACLMHITRSELGLLSLSQQSRAEQKSRAEKAASCS